MRDASKLTDRHRARLCVIYIRQSSYVQVERNRESTARQYDLAARAAELGWPSEAVLVIDEDLGLSGSGTAQRAGFARLAAEVGLGHVGMILSLEVSRLARSNADWYRLLDLCALTGTLIADIDGIYDPADYTDRLSLGLKGTIAEAELHVLRERLHGGIRNKAARGELRIALPVGLVWGQADGQVLLHPDEAVRGAIATVFDRFAELGSVRATWIWYRGEGLPFPYQGGRRGGVEWVTPSYLQIHRVLTHPAYAGAYVFGSTRQERYVDEGGRLHTRIRRLPMDDWQTLIVDHHSGYIILGHPLGQPGSHRHQHPSPGASAGHRGGPRRLRSASGPGGLRALRAQVGGPLQPGLLDTPAITVTAGTWLRVERPAACR